ncbi:MAG: HDOD domain-containing protein [Proteobacteria bacterium]|nr:HDOD domain-containing protein [Pseudomonadota bacterium]
MSEQTRAAEPQAVDVDRIAREIGIPPCPAILGSLSAEMRQKEPDTRKLAALIGTDVALSAALLKFVNSPFYGLRTKATNAHQALSIIGLRAGANLVTGLVLRQAFPAGSGPLMQRFWDDSGRMAAAAMAAARRLKGIDLDEAHTFALFRDCGMPVMIKKFPDYAKIYDSLGRTPGAQVTVAEEMRHRYSHARVGYALARGWMLPEPFCRAILFHHDYEKVAAGHRDVEPANRKLVAFGLLMEQVAAFRAGEGLCPDWEPGEKFVLETFGITPDEIIVLAQEAEPELD